MKEFKEYIIYYTEHNIEEINLVQSNLSFICTDEVFFYFSCLIGSCILTKIDDYVS